VFSGATPSQTLIPGLRWLNRQALATSEPAAGQINQGLGLDDRALAKFVVGATYGTKPFNEHPQVRRCALVGWVTPRQRPSRPNSDPRAHVWDQ
jgi:hypothetical protein